MGGGTGTGASPVVARAARERGILTIGVVTKPFHYEGQRRMRLAEAGIMELQKSIDTLIIIPNQNLFRVANEKTTFTDAFAMADQVLHSGVACITDLRGGRCFPPRRPSPIRSSTTSRCGAPEEC
jgi:cell division protein FtsZ